MIHESKQEVSHERQKVTFPELRALMAKYGVTYTTIGEIIENTYQTVSKKFNENTAEFSLTDMHKIKAYFIQLGEPKDTTTVDKLFFEWKFTSVNEIV
jgi:hypothetical protein